ncbi:DUF58 domain-containing protein [Pseudoxanthobacter sp.]|uniref:DUF58 domain-containing protein n=1 Tax=Pseudoxanthobacter sp. TaxID=1925742 RepID=UPI002FE39EF0
MADASAAPFTARKAGSGPAAAGRPGIGARALAASLPDLIIAARRVAASIAPGWHGRRRAGAGEGFWQFRPFLSGEPAHRVDWRRSARDEHLYVREREWEAPHTLWLHADLSASMAYRSPLAAVTKRERAVLLLLALAELAGRAGEKVGLAGLTPAIAHRHASERLALALAAAPEDAAGTLPPPAAFGPGHDLVLIGDFLDPVESLAAFLSAAAGRGVQGTLVQVLDPSEESFPFDGRTEFRDPETDLRLTAGRAEDWRAGYRQRLEAHRAALGAAVRAAGWTLIVHHTDRPASEALIALHGALSGSPGGRAGGMVR